jgi:hypothetical protein
VSDAFAGQLRIGAPLTASGGARVEIRTAPGADDGPRWTPLIRTIGDDEIGGLLEARTIEIALHAEQPVIRRGLHVREELLVSRKIAARREAVDATVRRMEAEVETLPGEGSDRTDFRD